MLTSAHPARGLREPLATRLGSWSATARQAAVIRSVKQLYATALHAAGAGRPVTLLRRPLGVVLDVDWTSSLRLRVIEDRDDVLAHWLHIEGPHFRLAARARTDDGPGFASLVVVSFVGDDRAASRAIGEALSTPL